MRFQVLTLFPDLVRGYAADALLARALRRKVIELDVLDIRDFSEHPQRKVDARPYGGGPGMVLACGPIHRAIEAAEAKAPGTGGRRVFLSPQGRLLDGELVRELAAEERLLLLCGRYEGVDARVLEAWEFEEVSVGGFVLAGGELPALVTIEAVTRWLPGALGHPDSVRRDALSAGRLGFKQYTRPPIWRDRKVPGLLRQGDHRQVAQWRRQQAETRTRNARGQRTETADGSTDPQGSPEA